MTYEFIPHTADIQFKASGETLEDLFSNCALAFSKSMTDDLIDEKKEVNIEVVGHDNENLLYNFLEELIVLFDSKYFILSKIKNIKIKNHKLKAKIIGDSSIKYNFHTDVKAITYSEMKIERHKNSQQIDGNESWETIVTLDV
jgi:SHS2 domain-containing protein